MGNGEVDLETELLAEISSLREQVKWWRRKAELRGQALHRECVNCGYIPLTITLSDGSIDEGGK